MDKKTSRILLVVSSVIALMGIGYFIYSKRQEKKMAEIYKKSVEDMANQYQIFK
jgi:preprotein translocase subunit YajC